MYEYSADESDAGPWPAFADLLAATALLFLILFIAVALPALAASREVEARASTLARLDSVLRQLQRANAVEVERIGDYARIVIRESATFPRNQHALATLQPEGRRILREFGRHVERNQLIDDIDQIQVVGHTSVEGEEERNWELSAARAATVALFLIDSVGVPACRVSAMGRSRYYPVNVDLARQRRIVDPSDRRIELEVRPVIPSDTNQRLRRDSCVEDRLGVR